MKAGADKRSAESLLGRLLKQDDDRRAGRAVPDGAPGGQTLGGWVKEYLEVLKARDLSSVYLDLVENYLNAILVGCKWRVWADVGPDRLLKWIAKRREPAEQGGNGIGPATANSYLRVAKGFSNWMAGRLRTDSPLRGKALPFFSETPDLRRSKRTLSDPELAAVLDAAERAPFRPQGFGGKDRAMLYRMASFSGLRASALAALRPIHFHLDANPPYGRDLNALLWPGAWAKQKRQVVWLARDLKRAGVAATDQKGRKVTFHSFKRRYVMGLIKSGGTIDQIKRMARHKDIETTLAYYVDADLDADASLVNKLPEPPKSWPTLGRKGEAEAG